MALEWEMPGAQRAQGSVSADALEDEAFVSTLQCAALAPPEDELNDAATERSMAEIHAAICRLPARPR